MASALSNRGSAEAALSSGSAHPAGGAAASVPNFRVPIFQSLYGRLALLFLGTLIAIGLVQLFVGRNEFIRLLDRINQQVYWELAGEIANRLQPEVLYGVDRASTEEVLHKLGMFVPFAEIYILDANGMVVATYPNHRGVAAEQIDLTPIRKALEAPTPDTPLYGQNPVVPDQLKVFSAAPLQLGSQPGYVYVLPNGFIMEELYRTSGGFFIARSLFGGFVVSTLLAAVLSFLLFRYLTRRFYSLTSTVQAFGREDFSVRAEVGSKDEVGMLAHTINTMADSLVDSRRQIAEQDRQRRELVASIAHDIRTPLTAVLGHLENALSPASEPLSETARTAILNARQSAFFQNGLIADLFELSTLDAGPRTSKDFVSARSIMTAIFNSLSSVAQARGIEFYIDIHAAGDAQSRSADADALRADVIVEADPKLLMRAITNLVDNALKFTPERGSVTLDLELKSHSAVFAVVDTGPGIAENSRERIFDSFTQIESDSRGVGLGLAIAKRVVELHNAKLQLDSSGAGCTFWFELEQAQDEAV